MKPFNDRLRVVAPAWMAALVVFVRAIAFPFVNWDDPLHVADNPLTASPLGQGLGALLRTPELGYPSPVLVLSFALDRALFGPTPEAFHAVNLVIHLVNIFLVAAFARRMGGSERVARAAALIFAIHPLVVEPVCWVTGRKDLLATALALGAILLAARAAAQSGRARTWLWCGACAVVPLAILSKPSAVVLPALIAILLAREPGRVRRAALPLLAMTATAGALAFVGFRGQVAVGAIASRTWTDAASDVGGAWAMQLGHLFWPIDLLPGYFRVPGDPSPAVMMLGVAAFGALGVAARAFPARSPERLGLAFALVAYLPASNVLAGRRWMADSYMYLPLVGIAIAVAAAVARLWPERRLRAGELAGGALVIALAVLSSLQVSVWARSSALWEPVVARYPRVAQARARLGWALEDQGDVPAAFDQFAILAADFPDYDDALDDEARALAALGQPDRAYERLAKGVRQGDAACLKLYWIGILQSRGDVSAADRALLAPAFEKGFAAMKAGLHDAAAFRRIAAILRAALLETMAAEADAQAAALEAATPAPR